MEEKKMEINIINIEDRHQEKAYAIWKAEISKTMRYGHFSKRTRSSVSSGNFAVRIGTFNLEVFLELGPLVVESVF